MNSIRKWIFRPKRSDTAYLAQFYYADEELNQVAAELDSFDGRKDPERCTNLVNQLRRCQDAVLNIVEKIMAEVIPNCRASRDYRVKFPDDVLQESLAGQLWFGAECLAAGSSILNHEVESASMRPLAKTLTHHLDQLRSMLREQSLKNQNMYNDRIIEALVEFDKLFAEFELSYVSAMVPVKTMREHDLLQEVMVLFCETVQRSLKLQLLTLDQIDAYDPALMFTIPRLAIVCGLLVYPEGPLNPDMDPLNMSEMFRPFQTLLFKIRELLWTLSREELWMLEKSLCSTDDSSIVELTNLQADFSHPRSRMHGHRSTASPPASAESGEDDEENNDTAIDYPSVMVHSDSTMTVVERAEFGLSAAAAQHDVAVVEADGFEFNSDGEEDLSSAQSESVSVLDDAVARRLQHSKSWPKSTDRDPLPTDQTHATANNISSNSANAGAENKTHEFNFNLPYNTGSQEQINNAQVSVEVGLARVPEGSLLRSRKPGFIYFAHSEDEEDAAQQISFITDAFCQLFNPTTPISSTVRKLRTNTSWRAEATSVVRENGSGHVSTLNHRRQDVDDAANGGDRRTEGGLSEDEMFLQRPARCQRWFSSPAGETSSGASASVNLICDRIIPEAAERFLPLEHSPPSRELRRPSVSYRDSDAGLSSNVGVVGSEQQADLVETDVALSKLSNGCRATSRFMSDVREVADETDVLLSTVISKTSFPNDSELQPNHSVSRNGLDSEVCDTVNEKHNSLTTRVLEVSGIPTGISCDSAVHNPTEVRNETGAHSQTLRNENLGRSVENVSKKTIVSTKQKVYSRISDDEAVGGMSSVGSSCSKSLNNTASVHLVMEASVPFRSLSSGPRYSSSIRSLEYDWDRESSETSSYTSENHDDEEIAMAIQAAEVAARIEARSRFKSSTDLIHRLFVCISGVADQLQTNNASDLRHILKTVFECNTSDSVEKPADIDAVPSFVGAVNDSYDYDDVRNSQPSWEEGRTSASQRYDSDEQNPSSSSEPPQWIPDEESSYCMACRVPFTFVRRRHHCRNCGKLFCSLCSSNSVPLPHFGHVKPVRVCNHCYMFRVTPFTTATH